MDTISAGQVRKMFLYVADIMIDSEAYLTEIDEQLGDGDHGIGMAIGFKGVKEELAKNQYDTVNDVLYAVGMTMLRVMGGASGVMFGTIFISGIVDMEKKKIFSLDDFAHVFTLSLQALKERGRARPGDKTMIDALEPAVLSLCKTASAGETLKQGFCNAARAAHDGMEATKLYKARFGRAKYYGERAIGLQDAGATSVYIIFSAMSRWMTENLL